MQPIPTLLTCLTYLALLALPAGTDALQKARRPSFDEWRQRAVYQVRPAAGPR